MRVQAPMLSLTAQGGFGIYFPWKKGPIYHYPIALAPKFPYHYCFSPYGYYYQRRRTWHGIIWAAHKYTPPIDPKNPAQLTRRQIFADAVLAWQNLTASEKAVYNKLKYPPYMSGYNKFLRKYLREH